MRRFWVALVMILGGALMGVLGLTENTAAIASKDNILKLAELQGVWDCYDTGYVNSSVSKNRFDIESNKVNYVVSGSVRKTVLLPTGLSSDSESKISCKVLFTSASNGLPKFGYNIPNTAAGLGYTASGNNYVISNKKVAAATAVKNITGGGSIGAGKAQSVSGGTLYQWDNKAKYALYYYYLENLSNMGYIKQGSCGSNKPSGYKYYFKKSSSEWCGIETVNNAESIQVHIPTAAGYRMKAGTMKNVLDDLIKNGLYIGFNDSDYVGSTAKLSVAEGTPQEGEQTEEKTASEMCYDAGMVSQSWFMCPAIENMSGFANGVDSLISKWLVVGTDLYDSNSDTYTIWEIMRNIANIALVLVLLAVIFSQLTGWGIDNYGIKKILPRLIAMAIVVNLSFIACQLIIDASNILGEALKNMFSSIGAYLSDGNSVDDFVPTMVAAMLAAVTGVGAGAGTAVTIGVAAFSGAGPMMVILIALALLSIVIAVLMFFLMLGARMVLVVLCTAVAPVVAVLYILPNTQGWAKKWWKIFWTMLVMYPICGAVLGISNLIKGMVLGGGEIQLWMAVVGIIGPFLPFFMLPTMLRSAISMLGNAGAALVNASQMARRSAGELASTVQNTAAAKNQMQMGRANLNRRLAGIGADGQLTARGQRLMDRARNNPNSARSRLAAARFRTAMSDQRELGGNENLFNGGFQSAMADIDAKNRDEAVGQRLSLMMSTGAGGGIMMDNEDAPRAYTLANMEARMRELEEYSRTNNLSGEQAMEMAALARGMAAEKGGAGMLGRIIRDSGIHDERGNVISGNTRFMSALGDIYSQDASVRSKMREKDAGASVYTEQFMRGGAGAGGMGYAAYSNEEDYRSQLTQRLKTASAGLGQGGAGIREYLGMVESGAFVDGFDRMSESEKKEAVREQYQKILEDTDLMNSLATDDRITVEARAASEPWRVTGRRPMDVSIVGGGQVQQQSGGVGQQTDGGIDDVNVQLRQQNRQMQEQWERTQYGGQTRQEAERAAEQERLRQEWMNQQNNQNS